MEHKLAAVPHPPSIGEKFCKRAEKQHDKFIEVVI
jgi:hypothetical protein